MAAATGNAEMVAYMMEQVNPNVDARNVVGVTPTFVSFCIVCEGFGNYDGYTMPTPCREHRSASPLIYNSAIDTIVMHSQTYVHLRVYYLGIFLCQSFHDFAVW